ncbi:MAG: type IV pilin N-terminal domain-containing protein [Candidatus Thermoplasmatota archaeon]
MKKPCKKKLNQEAVSAVIGVTIMVAITVAMAAVAYTYLTGMIGGETPTPVASFNIKDGTANANAMTNLYNANDQVFIIEHYSGDTITTSEITIEYKSPTGTWQTLTSTGQAAGLKATIPAHLQFGDTISVTAVDANTRNGVYLFRIRHNPSETYLLPQIEATAI